MWPLFLPKALYVTRTRRNDATGETPAKLLYGYEIPRAGEWQVPAYLEQREQAERIDPEVVADRQIKYLQKYAPPAPNPTSLTEGSQVFVRKPRGIAKPFDHLWEGPYEVTKQITPEIYEVNKRGRVNPYHIDDLRLALTHPIEDSSDETDSEGSNDEDEAPGASEHPTSSDMKKPEETTVMEQTGASQEVIPAADVPNRPRKRCSRLIIKTLEPKHAENCLWRGSVAPCNTGYEEKTKIKHTYPLKDSTCLYYHPRGTAILSSDAKGTQESRPTSQRKCSKNASADSQLHEAPLNRKYSKTPSTGASEDWPHEHRKCSKILQLEAHDDEPKTEKYSENLLLKVANAWQDNEKYGKRDVKEVKIGKYDKINQRTETTKEKYSKKDQLLERPKTGNDIKILLTSDTVADASFGKCSKICFSNIPENCSLHKDTLRRRTRSF